METGESPLDVLSRAATMVQDGLPVTNDETSKQAATKQLPTTKWKRERRSRLPEYTRKSDPKLPENLPPELLGHSPVGGSPKRNDSPTNGVGVPPSSSAATAAAADTPLDMSVRQRGLPPSYSQAISHPGYRSNYRPSVITQAPAGTGAAAAAATIPNAPPIDTKFISRTDARNEFSSGISMCDPIIDEHFRRSLGKDYAALFSNNNVTAAAENAANNPIDASPKQNGAVTSFKEMMDTDTASLSVDDHFAKALGETWVKLNSKKSKESDRKNGDTEKQQLRVLSI